MSSSHDHPSSSSSSSTSSPSSSSSSSWVAESQLTWLQRAAIRVLRCGPIPRHVAFIMDGNRRYATRTGLPSAADGHRSGFAKLAEALQWCLQIGIAEATVYAFSIENFGRSASEVETLMRLAGEKFEQLLAELPRLHEHGVCVRVVGRWALLPDALQRQMARAVWATRNNRKAVLNVAFAYTSRDEAAEAMRVIVAEVQQQQQTREERQSDGGDDDQEAQPEGDGAEGDALRASDVTEELLRDCMYTRRSADPELLVRTSGETRLSDFMLFQVSTSIVYFTDTLWPEFSVWHLLAGIFYYQTQTDSMQAARRLRQCNGQTADEAVATGDAARRRAAFVRRFDECETERMRVLSGAA